MNKMTRLYKIAMFLIGLGFAIHSLYNDKFGQAIDLILAVMCISTSCIMCAIGDLE